MTTYNSRVHTIINNDNYYLALTDSYTTTQPASSTAEFDTERGSVVLAYHGENGEISTGIVPSSLSFTMIADTSAKETYLDNILSDNDSTWYVILFKNESLYWWGYLNTETFSIDREIKPRYRFEAFDKLTLAGEQHFWDYTPYGFTAPTNTIFGLGWRKNQDPSTTTQIGQFGTNYSAAYPRNTTLLGIIYSCLFDTDMLNIGQVALNVVNWDVSRNPALHSQVAGIDRCLENWWVDGIDDFFFKDPANFLYNGGANGDDNRDWSISSILDDICKLFRARLFQKDGIYYFIQWEAYQGDPSAGNMRVHTYRNDLRTSKPTGSDVIFPDYKFTTVLGSTDFTTNIDAPRTDPELSPGTNTTFNQSADEVEVKTTGNTFNPTDVMFKRGLNYTIANNGPFSNFSEGVRKKEEFKVDWPWGHFIHLVYSSGTIINIKQSTYRYDGTTYQTGQVPEHMVSTLAEYKQGLRKILNTGLRGTYEFFKLLDLDGTVYLPVNLSTDIMNEAHTVEAVEFQTDDTNLGEVVTWGSIGKTQSGGGDTNPGP